MESKSLLIAIAAFAVTATGVHTYGGPKILRQAGLNKHQIVAVAEAHELRQAGDANAARDKLVEAGITDSELLAIHHAKNDSRSAMVSALEQNDHEAFLESIAGTPLADIVITQEDFTQFKEAYDLRQVGEKREAEQLFAELGVKQWGDGDYRPVSNDLFGFEMTDEQKQALQVARQANDRGTTQAIFDEAGWESRAVRFS